MRQEYRVIARENQEYVSDLREAKRQNAQLVETCTAIQKEAQSGGSGGSGRLTSREKSRYMEYYEYYESKAEFFQSEFKKRENHLQYLTKQTREANNEKDAAEDENRKLQRKIRELQAALTECRDDLLRLQPPTQMSDSELSEMYSNLCHYITTWVDDQTEDPDIIEKYFESLSSIDDLPTDVRTELNQRHFKLAKQHPEALPLLIQYIIHGRLKEEVLGPDVYVFGLDEANANLIQGVEEGMSELEPKRGTSSPLPPFSSSSNKVTLLTATSTL